MTQGKELPHWRVEKNFEGFFVFVLQEETMFERFWSLYPRKVSRGAALKSWTKLNPDATLANEICQAVENQKYYRERVAKANEVLPKWQKKFMPDWKHPATWLNQQCWLDEVPIVREVPKAKNISQCADCPEEGRYPFNGQRYCIKHYDEHAHGLKRA